MSSVQAVLSHVSGVASFATLVGPTRERRRHESPDLISTVAHELRTPLASLRLSLDMLVNDFDELEPERTLTLAQRAHRSVAWLQSMTDNLTSAAAAESGHLHVKASPVDVTDCIDEAIALVRALLDQRGQTVRVTSSSETPQVMADRPE